MKVLLVSADDAHDPNAWSGTAFQARAALEAAGHEVVVLTGLPTTRLPWHVALRGVLGAERYPLWMTGSTLRALGRRLERAEKKHRPDVILSISTQYLVKAEVAAPVVIFSDAPWQTFRERYSPYQRFARAARRYERLEADAARRATRLLFASQWAKDDAARVYGVTPERVNVIPLGANWTPRSETPVPPAPGPLRMLFVGRDWKRKGGDTAVAVQQHLRHQGVAAELTIVGVDESTVGPLAHADGITVLGRTGILEERGHTSMRALFENCHVLVVPSRAECFGIVYAEAAAFARPALALRVDAVGEVVLDAETGLLFEPTADPAEMATRIAALHGDPGAYRVMADNARAHWENRLNWRNFGRELTTVLEHSVADG